MLASMLDLMCCRRCRGAFSLEATQRDADDVVEGVLVCSQCKERAPIVGGIPRFVPAESYANNFGLQWNRFGELQVDRLGGHTLSRDRFWLETGLQPADLRGRRVLDAGCGGGRFSDIALEAGAEVVAADLSSAVDKNRAIHLKHPRFLVVQASITDLPLRHEAFDLVFSFGVLQHTPDPAATFRALAPFVRPGGRIAVDVYAAHPKQTLHWKYLLRPLTRRMDDQRLLAWIEWATPKLMPLTRALRSVPVAGKALTRLVPLKIHDGILRGEFPPEEEVRLAVLETFDAYSPAYDRPRSRRTVERWLRDAGFDQVETACLMRGLNYGRGTRPARADARAAG
jgi:SAM-dependent methyltransferase